MSGRTPERAASAGARSDAYGTRAAVRSYAQEKRILGLVDDLVDVLLRDKPNEPLEYLTDMLVAQRAARSPPDVPPNDLMEALQTKDRESPVAKPKRRVSTEPPPLSLPTASSKLDVHTALVNTLADLWEQCGQSRRIAAERSEAFNGELCAALPTDGLRALWRDALRGAVGKEGDKAKKDASPRRGIGPRRTSTNVEEAEVGMDNKLTSKFDGTDDARLAQSRPVEVYSREYAPGVDVFEVVAGLKGWHCAGKTMWPDSSIDRLQRNCHFVKLHHNYGEPDAVVLPLYLYTCSLHDTQSWAFWVRSAAGQRLKTRPSHGWTRMPKALTIKLERAHRRGELAASAPTEMVGTDAAFIRKVEDMMKEQVEWAAMDKVAEDVAEDDDTFHHVNVAPLQTAFDLSGVELNKAVITGAAHGEAWAGLDVWEAEYAEFEFAIARYEVDAQRLYAGMSGRDRRNGHLPDPCFAAQPMAESVMWLPAPYPHMLDKLHDAIMSSPRISAVSSPNLATLTKSPASTSTLSASVLRSPGEVSLDRRRSNVKRVSQLRLPDLPPPGVWEYMGSRRSVENLYLPTGADGTWEPLCRPALAGPLFADVQQLVKSCFSQQNQQEYNADLHLRLKILLGYQDEEPEFGQTVPCADAGDLLFAHLPSMATGGTTPEISPTDAMSENTNLLPFTGLIEEKLGEDWAHGQPTPLKIAHSFDIQTVLWNGGTELYASLSGERNLVLSAEDGGKKPCDLYQVGSMFDDQPYYLLNATARNLQQGRIDARVTHVGRSGKMKETFVARPPSEIGKGLRLINEMISDARRVTDFACLLNGTTHTSLANDEQKPWRTVRYAAKTGAVPSGRDAYLNPVEVDQVGWWLHAPDEGTPGEGWWAAPPAPQPSYLAHVKFDIGVWMLPQLRPALYYIDRALQTMTPYISSKKWHVAMRNTKCYRGLRDAKLNPQVYGTGNVVVWGAFSSASLDMSISDMYASGSDSSVFVIKGSTARCVAPWSRYGREEEWLFPLNSMFRITHMLSDDVKMMIGNDAQIYELEEVDNYARYRHAVKRHLWRAKNRQSAGIIFAAVSALRKNCVMDLSLSDENDGIVQQSWKIAVSVNFDPLQSCPIESSNLRRPSNLTAATLNAHVETILRAIPIDESALRSRLVSHDFDAAEPFAHHVFPAVSSLLGVTAAKGPDFIEAHASLDKPTAGNTSPLDVPLATAAITAQTDATPQGSAGPACAVSTPRGRVTSPLLPAPPAPRRQQPQSRGSSFTTNPERQQRLRETFLDCTSQLQIDAKKPSGGWEVAIEMQRDRERRGHAIGDEGASIIKFILAEGVPLQRIDLKMNRITVEGASELLQGLRYNNHVVQLTFTDLTAGEGRDETAEATGAASPKEQFSGARIHSREGSFKSPASFAPRGVPTLQHLQILAELRCRHNKASIGLVSVLEFGVQWPQYAAEALWDVAVCQMKFGELFDHDVKSTEAFIECLIAMCERNVRGNDTPVYPLLPGAVVAAARAAGLATLERLLALPNAAHDEIDVFGETAFLKFSRRQFNRKETAKRNAVRKLLWVSPPCLPPPAPKYTLDILDLNTTMAVRHMQMLKTFALKLVRWWEEKIKVHRVKDLAAELCTNFGITTDALRAGVRKLHDSHAAYDLLNKLPVGRLYTTLILFGLISGSTQENLQQDPQRVLHSEKRLNPLWDEVELWQTHEAHAAVPSDDDAATVTKESDLGASLPSAYQQELREKFASGAAPSAKYLDRRMWLQAALHTEAWWTRVEKVGGVPVQQAEVDGTMQGETDYAEDLWMMAEVEPPGALKKNRCGLTVPHDLWSEHGGDAPWETVAEEIIPPLHSSLNTDLCLAARNLTLPVIYGGSAGHVMATSLLRRWVHTWACLNAVIMTEVPTERVLFFKAPIVTEASARMHTMILRKGVTYGWPHHSLWREERRVYSVKDSEMSLDDVDESLLSGPMTEEQFRAIFNDSGRHWDDADPWEDDPILMSTPSGPAFKPRDISTPPESWALCICARGKFRAASVSVPGNSEWDVVLPALETFVVDNVHVCKDTMTVTITLMARVSLYDSDPELALWMRDVTGRSIRTAERFLLGLTEDTMRERRPSTIDPYLQSYALRPSPGQGSKLGGRIVDGLNTMYIGRRVQRHPEDTQRECFREHRELLRPVNVFGLYRYQGAGKDWYSHKVLHPKHALPYAYRLSAVFLEKLGRPRGAGRTGMPWVELPSLDNGQLTLTQRDQRDVIEISAATVRELYPEMAKKYPDPWFEFLGVPPPDPEDVFGKEKFEISIGQVQQLLKSFHVELASQIPRKFYERLVECLSGANAQGFWRMMLKTPMHHVAQRWRDVYAEACRRVDKQLAEVNVPDTLEDVFKRVDKTNPNWVDTLSQLHEAWHQAECLREDRAVLAAGEEALHAQYVKPFQEFVDDVTSNYLKYGFKTASQTGSVLCLSVADLSNRVCVSQRCYFFTKSTDGADNQLRYRSYRNVACLNIPGIDFASIPEEAERYFISGITPAGQREWVAFQPGPQKACLRGRVKALYECIFAAAQQQGVHSLSAMPLGLGNFARTLSATLQTELFELYFAVQIELLCEHDYGFHTFWMSLPPTYRPLGVRCLDEGLRHGGSFNQPTDGVSLRCNIFLHNKCAKALASHLADRGVSTGLLVATDAKANILGCLGSTWEDGRGRSFGGDQDWAVTCTGVLGSFDIARRVTSKDDVDGVFWSR